MMFGYLLENNRNMDTIESSLSILLEHLYKYLYIPAYQTPSWTGSILESYRQVVKLAINGKSTIVTPKTNFRSDFVKVVNDPNKIIKINSNAANNIILDNPGFKASDFIFESFYGYFDSYYSLCDSTKIFIFLMDNASTKDLKEKICSQFIDKGIKMYTTNEDLNEMNYSKNPIY